MLLANDPIILLSMVNTKLRDFYDNLDELCAAEDIDRNELETRLAQIGYIYNPQLNKFV